MAKKVGELFAELKLKSDKFTSEIKKAESKFSGLKKRIFTLSNGIQGVLGGVMVAKLGAFIKSSIGAFATQEKALALLKTQVELQGGSWDKWGAKIKNITAKMQDLTGVGDELQQQAMSKMLVTGASLTQVMKNWGLVMDFAAGTGMDLGTSGMYIARAMMGQPEMLARYIPKIRDLSKEERNWDNVQKILKGSLHGLAATMGDTTEGSIKKMKSAFGDLKEKIGSLFKPLIDLTTKVFVRFAKELQHATQQVNKFFGALKKLVSLRGTMRAEIDRDRKAWEKANDLYRKGKISIQEYTMALKRYKTAQRIYNESIRKEAEAQSKAKKEEQEREKAVEDLNKAIDAAGSKQNLLNTKIRTGNKALADYGFTLKNVGSVQDSATESLGRTTKAQQSFKAEVESLKEEALTQGIEALWDYTASLFVNKDALAQQIKELEDQKAKLEASGDTSLAAKNKIWELDNKINDLNSAMRNTESAGEIFKQALKEIIIEVVKALIIKALVTAITNLGKGGAIKEGEGAVNPKGLATGGAIYGERGLVKRPIIIGEAGSEAVVPLKEYDEMLKAKLAVSGEGGVSKNNVNINVNIEHAFVDDRNEWEMIVRDRLKQAYDRVNSE